MGAEGSGPDLQRDGAALRHDVRSAAHDLRNLVYRLTFLAENLQREMPSSPAREEARDLIADTSERLTSIAERLRRLSVPES